jgi:hypothetical protein
MAVFGRASCRQPCSPRDIELIDENDLILARWCATLSGMIETDVVRWAGVIVGVAGAIVVAPSGARSILLTAWVGVCRTWAAIRRIWDSFVTGKKEPVPAVNVMAGLAAAHGTAGGTLALRRHGAPVEEQLRLLWDGLDRLAGQIRKIGEDNQSREEAIAARLAREGAARRQLRAELAAERRRDERQAARVNACGLPLIGLGIVMTGIPDGLAKWAWVGWLFIAIATVLVLGLALWPFSRWMANWPKDRHRDLPT